MPDISERILEVAKDALSEQERQVSEMRTRGAAVLAAGGVVGGLLGKEAFVGGHPTGAAEWISTGIGLAAAVGLLISAVGLFVLRRLAFSVDAIATYTQLFAAGITTQPRVDLELADLLARTRAENERPLGSLRICLDVSLGCLTLLSAALATAAALAS